MRAAAIVVAALALAPAPAALAADRGRQLYFANCVWCHGERLQGVPRTDQQTGPGGRDAAGPPLAGVGERAADFYLRMGYMPIGEASEQPRRRRPRYPERDLRALIAFVAAHGGPRRPQVHPERGSLAQGLTVFTEKCAGCHQVVGEGGVVTGARVPTLKHVSAEQIAEAVRIGPYVMPRYGERDLSRHELDSVVRYVLYARNPKDSGGWAIGRLGPMPEGAVAWLLAGVAVLLVARVIGEGLTRR
jgi:ubiquinol-cytochrome c reductase cytochrome c subunit